MLWIACGILWSWSLFCVGEPLRCKTIRIESSQCADCLKLRLINTRFHQNRESNFGPFSYPSDREVPFDGIGPITLLARSLAPPIMSLGFVPRGSFRQLPVECRYCLLQFAYYTLSALHFNHLLRKIYFISVLYTSIRKIKILLKLT